MKLQQSEPYTVTMNNKYLGILQAQINMNTSSGKHGMSLSTNRRYFSTSSLLSIPVSHSWKSRFINHGILHKVSNINNGKGQSNIISPQWYNTIVCQLFTVIKIITRGKFTLFSSYDLLAVDSLHRVMVTQKCQKQLVLQEVSLKVLHYCFCCCFWNNHWFSSSNILTVLSTCLWLYSKWWWQ